jgi:sugar (pentulose or hexulose) kinase
MQPSRPAKAARDGILTYDLGTTRIKVALFSLRGRLIGQRVARNQEHRQNDHAWQDADAWWADAVHLTRELLAAKPGRVVAIAVSGRGGAAVFIGRDGTVIGQPWSDRRHNKELEALVDWRRGDAQLPSYAAALLAKKLWFAANEPLRARQLRHVLYAKDLLVFRLTGQAVTDPSSGPDAMAWDSQALEHTLCTNLVPRVALPWTIAGPIAASAARALGLPDGVPVVVGAHDGVCANVGAAAAYPGAYAITLGTNAVVRTVQATSPADALRFYGLPPDRHVLGANVFMGGRAPDWFLDLIYGANDRSRARHLTAMDGAAMAIAPGAGGIRFLPFLTGQVAPEPRPGASAAFYGLRTAHDRVAMYRAVLEGVAFSIRSIFDPIHASCGEPSVIRLTGSGARSATWCDILANVLNRTLEASDEAVEGRGAAIFATVALGLYPDYDSAGEALARVARRHAPDPTLASTYAELYEHWRAVVAATRPLDRIATASARIPAPERR